MGTRSTIALEYADGTVGQIYCHWDGYLDHNGKILQNYYTDPFKVRELLDGGDMSSLSDTVAGCSFYALYERGEDCPQRMYKDYAEFRKEAQGEEYDYILRLVDGKAVWFVRCYASNDKWVTLAEAREMEAIEEGEDW
jgi:hypothetical protein